MKNFLCFFAAILFAAPLLAQRKDENEIKAILQAYKTKLEQLDTSGITPLFVSGAKVYEGGTDEGGIQSYLGHHLGPELKAFKSFTFSNYQVDVVLNEDYAYATETYLYTIVLAKDDSVIKSKGVATTVLRKTRQGWKIALTHSSFRRAK
ncbi:YybH family protein [Flaviaesturariibacter amylovorans]|uniref:SnoaL-like domain-containing protein n=1 Tax=Flaviaesturariibacter amylovorans TaxID=1084520 RepID=A0ABP8HKX2_9BACT